MKCTIPVLTQPHALSHRPPVTIDKEISAALILGAVGMLLTIAASVAMLYRRFCQRTTHPKSTYQIFFTGEFREFTSIKKKQTFTFMAISSFKMENVFPINNFTAISTNFFWTPSANMKQKYEILFCALYCFIFIDVGNLDNEESVLHLIKRNYKLSSLNPVCFEC